MIVASQWLRSAPIVVCKTVSRSSRLAARPLKVFRDIVTSRSASGAMSPAMLMSPYLPALCAVKNLVNAA
jgi:hypothetical protein